MELIFLHLKRIVISAYHDRVSVFVLLIGVFIVPTLTLIFVNWESNRFIQFSAGNNPHFQIRRVQTAVINMITPEFMLSIPDVNVSINTPPISPNFLIPNAVTAQEISERTSLEINELYNLDDFGILIRFLENNLSDFCDFIVGSIHTKYYNYSPENYKTTTRRQGYELGGIIMLTFDYERQA